MEKFKVDIDFYSMELEVWSKNKTEARKKVKQAIQKKILSHINHMYINK